MKITKMRDEQGSISIMFFFLIPLLLLIVALVIEIARFELSKKDMENATDAAALSAVGKVAELALEADTDVVNSSIAFASNIATEIVNSYSKHGYYIPYDNTGFDFDGQTVALEVKGAWAFQFHSYIPWLDNLFGSSEVAATSRATVDYDNGNLIFYTSSSDLIVDRVPWAIHHYELHDDTYAVGGDKYTLAALPGGKFQAGQEYILKLGSFKDELPGNVDQWHVTDSDSNGFYDDDRNYDGFHDDDVDQVDDNGDYVIIGSGNGGTAWEPPHTVTMTNMIYIPMDATQAQPLKAYSVVYTALASGDAYWCLGLDGGAFAIPDNAANVALLTAAGVTSAGIGRTPSQNADGSWSSVAGGASLTYNNTIMLDHQPPFFCYSTYSISGHPANDPLAVLFEEAGFTDAQLDMIDANDNNNNVRVGGVVGDGDLSTMLGSHEWVACYNRDFTSDSEALADAAAIADWVEVGGTAFCQNLAGKTMDQALELNGAPTMAFTNPVSGNTLTQNGYVAALDNNKGATNYFLCDDAGEPYYLSPLDQSASGYGNDAAGAADYTDFVTAVNGNFSSINPEFVDATKNLAVNAWFDPLSAGSIVFNEVGWKSATTIVSEANTAHDINNDGDQTDNPTIEDIYTNRAAWAWTGFVTQNDVTHWEPEHTETVIDYTTVVGHSCTKPGCHNQSNCNDPHHSGYWTGDVYQTTTVTVPGQYVHDYYQYQLDLNQDGDYVDALTGSGMVDPNSYIKLLSGTYGKGAFAFASGAVPTDLAGKRLILNSLLTAAAKDGIAFFGGADLDGTDGEAGAGFYRNNTWFGFYDSQNDYHRFLDKGDILLAEGGNLCGPTQKSVMYRYNTDPDKELPFDEHMEGTGRLVLVPIVELEGDTYAYMYDLPRDASDADRRLRVIGSAIFFVRDLVHETAMRSDLGPVKPGQVRGIFIRYEIEP